MKTNYTAVKDSGVRQDFATGSRRDTREGKGRFDLLPPRALKRLARHFENGSRKYGDRNWELGQPLARYLDSGIRHAFAHLQGDRDEDHLAAAAWNLMCLIETEERIALGLLPKELNDLPLPVVRDEGVPGDAGRGTRDDENLRARQLQAGQQIGEQHQ